MNKGYSTTLTLAFVIALLVPADALAQLRPEQTVWIKPRVGIGFHLGDTEQSPFNFNMDNWKANGIPFGAGLELGYQFNQNLGLSLGYQATNHPLAFHYGPDPPPGGEHEDDETLYHAAQLLLRLGTSGRVAPFFAIGGHVTIGTDDRASTAFGPAAGLGLDIVLSPRTSLVLEWLANLTFPDDAFDGVDEVEVGPGESKDFAPFDMVNSLTLGLKYNFRSAMVPVDILSIDCPTQLQVNQTGQFIATINQRATRPLEFRWDFGDGTTGTGLTTSHSYDRAGTYTVRFTASNRGSTDTETCVVEVVPEPQAPSIVSITANPPSFELCEPTTVNFTSNVTGDAPITYSWDFGDGSTGTGPNPSHTYTEPGTYTVTLTATNEIGTDTRSITVEARECVSICPDITELNSVYFARNSSTLTAEARAALQENIDILRECPDICVRIEGFAGPGERNPQQLSTDRARAVEQFYIDNGISANRLTATGRGLAGVTTTKKEGQEQFRRVDSIPVPCVEMGMGE